MGWTPLHICFIYSGGIFYAHHLIQAGADLNAVTKSNASVFDLALHDTRFALMVLGAGANPRRASERHVTFKSSSSRNMPLVQAEVRKWLDSLQTAKEYLKRIYGNKDLADEIISFVHS